MHAAEPAYTMICCTVGHFNYYSLAACVVQYSGTANFEISITKSLKSFHAMHADVVMLLCKAKHYYTLEQ